MKREHLTAIVLAAGKGSRMHSDQPKQYMELEGRPLIYYALLAFEQSIVDEIILVTTPGEEAYCQKEIIEKYQISKCHMVISGGAERYNSVYCGLKTIKMADYVYVHDGARPFLTPEMIAYAYKEVKQYKACIFGVPVKDTIKIANSEGFVEHTPARNMLWSIQTPQVFSYELLKKAYDLLFENKPENITDDAMVVEQMLHHSIKIIEGSYENIKITTPEDMPFAQQLLRKRIVI